MAKFKFYAFKLTGIIIMVFLLQLLFSGLTDLFVLNQVSWQEPWRFVASMFLHGSVIHLLFNMFALVLFGSMLEKFVGGKKFLWIYFVSGILANVVSINFYDSALGASGAIFGVIGALIYIKPWLPVWAFGMPLPLILAGLLWIIGDVIGIFVPSNVANIAHLSGMVFGLILGMIFKKRVKKRKRKNYLDEREVRHWEEGWMGK